MEIPLYPERRALVLADKSVLDDVFSLLQPRISEFTFANLYLFRNAHHYELSMVNGSLVVFGTGYDGIDYFLPPLGGDIHGALARLFDDSLVLYGADEQFLHGYPAIGNDFEIIEDRDSFDYLYLRQELAELPGNRFHKKKNRINYFARRHDYRLEPYAPKHLDAALSFLDEWQRVRAGIESPSMMLEAEASADALAMAFDLGLEGVVALVNGEMKGFVLGEKLNDVTSLCHFEKADPFLDGLYQLIDREFCRLCFTECVFVNREQDLGEPNLRASKLSYHPVELIKKFRVRKK
jgi:uncharacterized protein